MIGHSAGAVRSLTPIGGGQETEGPQARIITPLATGTDDAPPLDGEASALTGEDTRWIERGAGS
jgi:hypothetical protein